jgi:hypothetical protein
VFTIEQTQPGRRTVGRCKKPKPSNHRKPRCVIYRLLGRVTQQATAGADSERFSGRVGKLVLSPGSYRATLIATDPAGRRSAPARISFSILHAS